MRKKFLFIFVALSFICCLVSCRIQFPGLSYGQSWVHSLDYSFSDKDKEEIENRMAKLDELVMKDSYQDLNNEYIRFIKGDVYSILTYQSQAYLKYSIDMKMDSYNQYQDITNYLMKIEEWETKFYKKVYDSSFKEQFFIGYSEEEILDLIKEYPKEYYDLEEENNKLYSEYESISDVDVNERIPSLYKELVVNFNKQAKLCGYDDYRDFAYKNVYGRDYKYNDTKDFSNYTKSYVISALERKINEFDELKSKASTKNINAVSSFISDKYTGYQDEFESFAKEIGGSYYLAYQSLFDNGYYYFSDNAMEGAYTTYLNNKNTPVCFFGPGYQDISTVVHEFGHYYSMLQRGNQGGSFDLAETQSQANEALFLSYLVSYKKLSDKTLSMIKDYYLSDLLLTIVLSSIVNDFENIVYSSNSLSVLDLDQTFINVCDNYGGYEHLKELVGNDFDDYWRYVVVNNPLYYISYSVGLIPAINLYQLGLNDFTKAANIYNSIVIYDYNMPYLELLNNAGLANPFDESSFSVFNII